MNAPIDQQILNELRKTRYTGIALTVFVLLLALVAIPILTKRNMTPPQTGDGYTWSEVRRAVGRMDYQQAAEITRHIIQKAPQDYYGYSYLGQLELSFGNLGEAETAYKKAYELFPSEENQKNLSAVEQRIANQNQQTESGPVGSGQRPILEGYAKFVVFEPEPGDVRMASVEKAPADFVQDPRHPFAQLWECAPYVRLYADYFEIVYHFQKNGKPDVFTHAMPASRLRFLRWREEDAAASQAPK